MKAFLHRQFLLLIILCLYLAANKALGITCPFLALTGISCPTCGVTRAMLSLAKGDFAGYLAYQPMAIFLCLAVWLMLNLDIFPKKKALLIYSTLTVVLNFLFWGLAV